jgi:hypothetical protein
MAWLEKRSGLCRVAFRHGGRKLHYSVGSDNHKENLVTAASAAISREIRVKGKDARFVKSERGKFATK